MNVALMGLVAPPLPPATRRAPRQGSGNPRLANLLWSSDFALEEALKVRAKNKRKVIVHRPDEVLERERLRLEKRGQMRTMRGRGLSYNDIAKAMGCSASHVRREVMR